MAVNDLSNLVYVAHTWLGINHNDSTVFTIGYGWDGENRADAFANAYSMVHKHDERCPIGGDILVDSSNFAGLAAAYSVAVGESTAPYDSG